MTEQLWISIISSVFAGLATFATLLFTLMERRRNHLRQMESELYREKLSADLERAKNATVEVARKVAEEVKEAVASNKETRATEIKIVTDAIDKNSKDALDAIDKNTSMNEKALDAANHVNNKIQTLGLQIAEQKGADRMASKLDAIEAKVVTIEAKNVEIHSEKSPYNPSNP